MIWGFLTGIGGRVAAVVAAIAAAGAGYLAIRRGGEKAAEAKATAREVQDDAKASAARSGVDSADAAAVDRRLRDDGWTRRG